MIDSRDNSLTSICCDICGRAVTNKSNLSRHKRNVHNYKIETKCRLKCPENVCTKQFNRDFQLADHMKIMHNVDLISEEHKFKSEEGKAKVGYIRSYI